MNTWCSWWWMGEGDIRGHTGKGVFLGSEGGDEGILLFLGWGRQEGRLRDWFGSRRRSDHGRRRHNLVNEGEVLLHGELGWGEHGEI